ncbi:MAG: transglutaminase-like domain-containing protein [Gammaproteobacteria bacterium]|nr:transglutaminase-like domain-containing protein [Gammaproteobacteria bacterium]
MIWLAEGLTGLFVALIAGRVAWSASFEGLALLLVLLTLAAAIRRFPVVPPNAGLGFLLLVMGGLIGYFSFEDLADPGSWAAYFRVAAGMTLGATFQLVWWYVARPPLDLGASPGSSGKLYLNLTLLGIALLLLTPEPVGAPAIPLGRSRLPLSLLLALFSVLVAQLLQWHRRLPWRRLLWLLPVLPLAFGFSQGLRSAQRPLLGAIYGMMPDFESPATGFSPFQSLPSSAFLSPSEKVVLRVETERLSSPYLVGSRHSHFDGKKMSWSGSPVESQSVVSSDQLFQLDFGVHMAGSGSVLQIDSLRRDSYLFLPPDVGSVSGELSGISQKASGVLDGTWNEDVRRRVEVTTGPGSPQPVDPVELELPQWWDDELEEYASQFAAESRAATAHAMATAFGERQYSLQVNLDRKRPFHDFLLNEKPAFCFWYASAGALLLRSQGVPSRLVSGYRVWESLASGVWIVRERDAHSWVEWQDEIGYWHPLDPTPPSLGLFLDEYRSSALNRFVHLWKLRLRNWWDGVSFTERFEQSVIGGGFVVLLLLFVREYRRIARRKVRDPLEQWGRLWRRFLACSGLPDSPMQTAGAISRQLPSEWPPAKVELCQQFLALYQRNRFGAEPNPPFADMESLLRELRRSRCD